jgi:gliding motility-associated-like protein
MIRRTFFLFFCLFFSFFAKAQLNCNVTTKASTCSANGVITAAVTNGSGVYNYQLSSTTPGCLTNSVLQNNNVFNSLKPCTYTLLISDVANGQTCTQTVTVGGNYISPSMTLNVTNCKVVSNVLNGNDPFSYAYSTVSTNGPFTPNTPPNANTFNMLPSGTVWIQVQDSCGNTYVSQTNIGTNPISNFTYALTNGNIVVSNVIGGNAPYTYTLTTTAGVFTNSTGNFAGIPIDCTTKIKVNDACTFKQITYNLAPNLFVNCINFTNGTLNLSATEGVPPYTYIVKSNGATIGTNTTGIFTNLPKTPSVFQYDISLVDACNKTKNATVYAPRPTFSGSTNCNGTGAVTVGMIRTNGSGSPMFYPINVTCNSCVPQQTKTIASSPTSTSFTGLSGTPNIFTITDACGENITCKDSLIIILNSNCTDINAQIRREVRCNNGTLPSSIGVTGVATFTLKDAAGMVLETNTTGNFTGYPPGTYTVTAAHPTCGTVTGTVIVSPSGAALAITPSVQVRYITVNGKCIPRYNIRLDASKGPYFIVGGTPSTSVYMNTLTGGYYWRYTVVPGTYTITSTTLCSSITINLPVPNYNLLATAASNCPSDGQAILSGAYDYNYWKNWFSQNHSLDLLTNSGSGTHQDFYSLSPTSNTFTNYVGSPYTIHNLANNMQHTFYLYQYDGQTNSTCPIDTAKITLPAYFQLTSQASRGIICDGGNSANINFWVKPKTSAPFKKTGNPPYTYQIVDCANLSQPIGAPKVTSDSLVTFTNLSQGTYCLKVVDNCGISSDFQTEVSPLGTAQYIAASCSEVKLQIDTIPGAIYTWRNANNAIIGNKHLISIATPSLSQTFNCTIQIGVCTFYRSITVPGGLSGVTVAIQASGNTTICNGQSVLLQAVSTVNDYKWSNGQVGNSILVSAAGNYAVTATNALGCKTSTDININVASPILAALTKANIKCFGEKNGEITANISVGNTPFSYRWNTGATTQRIANLSEGNYILTITDGIGCTQVFNQNISQPADLQINTNFKNPTCAKQNNGSATALSFGGTAPFTYIWSNGLQNNIISGLTSGVFSLTVSDVNGCSETTSVNITEPPALSLNVSPNNASVCKGEKIALQANATGGTNTLNYIWNNGNKTTSINVGAGTYRVTVSDANQCSETRSVTIVESSKVTPPLVGNPDFCEGKSTTLGVGGVFQTYQWNTGDTTATISISASQKYCVTVTTSGGCKGDTCVKSIKNKLPKVELKGDTSVCKGNNATIFVVKNTSFSSYQWSNNATSDSVQVKAGAFIITVTDKQGCQATNSITIKEKPLPKLSLLAPKQFCKGDSIALEVMSNFETYSWNTGITTKKIKIKKGGQYCVSISDVNKCKSDTCITIVENILPVAKINGTFEFCEKQTTILSAEGNFSQYQWSNNSKEKTLKVDKKGKYCLNITDINGCQSDTCIIVKENALPKFSIVGDTAFCEGKTQVFTIDNPSFTTYKWSDLSTSGIYKVTVADAKGCESEKTLRINVLKNPKPSIVGNPFFCKNGNTIVQTNGNFAAYDWSNFSNTKNITISKSGKYTLTVTDNFGCRGRDSIEIKEIAKLRPLLSGKFDFCEGSTTILKLNQNFAQYQWSNGNQKESLTVSKSGTYCVTVSDANGCKGDTCAQIVMLPKPTITIQGDDVFCDKEKIILTANSLTNQYLWNTGSMQKSINVGLGKYSVTTTDSKGCKNSSDYTVKQNLQKQTLVLDTLFSIKKLDTVQLFPKFKQQPDSMRWSPPTEISCVTCQNPFVFPSKNSFYELMAWKNGCPINAIVRFAVQQKFDKEVYVPNIFSPNGDRINDIFTIYKHPNLLLVKSLRIFDRWGSMVHEGYNFEPEVIGWDGYWRGKLADQAVYVWYGEVLFKDGSTQWLKGDVMLMW